MRKLLRRIQYALQARRRDAELGEEMEFHRALKERWEAEPPQVSRALGNVTLAREDARAVWIAPWLESLWRDLVYGARMLRRQPAFTAVALAGLGSAIGINTCLFTVFNAVALRPWPVKDPSQVVSMYRTVPADPSRNRPAGTSGFSVAEYRYLAEHTKAFSGAVALRGAGPLKLDGVPVSFASYVSGNYFSALGVGMERGRGFLSSEDRAGAPEAIAVIGYSLWQNRLGGDLQIIGRSVRLEGVPFTVVGVTPPDFVGTWTEKPLTTDLWVPLASMTLLRPNDPTAKLILTSPDFCCSQMAGRLAPGKSRDQAQAEANLLLNRFAGHSSDRRPVVLTGTAILANPGFKRKTASPLILMFFGVTLVLLLACANTGNLLLARAAARRQEIAVRLSIGAGRTRLIRQLLVESMLLALLAGAIGLALAAWLPGVVVRQLTDSIVPRLAPDWTVLAYTAALSALACLSFGLAPALHATRGHISKALPRNSEPSDLRLTLRGILLAVQVAISVILLTGAGVLVRGIQSARKLDPGFAISNVTSVSLDLPASAYGGPRTAAFIRELRDALQSNQGLPPWGLTTDAPLGNQTFATSFRLVGEDAAKDRMVQYHGVTGGYFDVLGIRMIAGRNLVPADAERKVALINQTMARRYWPDGAVGKIVVLGNSRREIVGVVADAATRALGQVDPTIYWPLDDRWIPNVLLRAGPASATPIEAIVKRIEPRAEVRAAPLENNFQNAMQPAAIGAAIAGLLGVLALGLASIGMAGVFAYMVRQRSREIGIRMALGARSGDVVLLVVGSSMRALLAGLAGGLAGAALLAKVMSHQFYGVQPLDPLAYGAVLLLLILAAVAASAGPARRATRLDPVAALRWE